MLFLRSVFFSAATLLVGAATMNFLVDPANVFRVDPLGPDRYALELIKSPSGLYWPENSYDDRRIKKALTRHASQFDCVVIGSSHIMQVGSGRKAGQLAADCRRILNLGVSGATLEDYFVLSYLVLRNARPSKLILGTPPWGLSFGKSQAWSYYKADFEAATKEILGNKQLEVAWDKSADISRIANLFTIAYTIQSVKKIADIVLNNASNPSILPAPEVEETVGSDLPVLRPDGSLIYSSKYLQEADAATIPLGGTTYLTGGPLNQEQGILAYRVLLRWIRQQGSEPEILLTPYHERVMTASESKNAAALRATEPILREVAKSENVKLIGSYRPNVTGCLPQEFLDFMHAKPSCLAKIR